MHHAFVIGAPDAGRRLDRFLQSALKGAPASLLQRLLRQGKVRVNGVRAKGHHRLSAGDEVVVHHVRVDLPSTAAQVAYRGPDIDVLHRCDEYLVVNKPAGVSCSTAPRPGHSLPVWAQSLLADQERANELRPSPCHRLDTGTTGIVVIALTAAATTRFHAALSAGEVEKIYQVAVWGETPAQFDVDLALVRRPHGGRHEPKVVAGALPAAQEALTRFRRLDATSMVSLLRAEPLTGRTHQIRAHLLASGWPVVGDPRYGDAGRDQDARLELDHQLLHAARIAFPAARGRLEIVAPLPPESSRALKQLGLTPSLKG